MSVEVLWTALALMLVIEGLMPLLTPGRWRALFQRMTVLSDGQIRFVGLACVAGGLLGLVLLH